MSKTPDEIWDELYRQTHKGTDKASWELSDDDLDIEDEEYNQI